MTGYLVPEDQMGSIDGYMSDEEMDEDLQDEEEEEVAPKLVKKRKLQNGDSPKMDKKPLDILLTETKKVKKDDTNKTPERLADEIKQAEAMKKILEKKKGTQEESEEDASDDDSDDDDIDDSEVIFAQILL